MTERVAEPVLDIVAPAINHIVTEDDEPVDNLPSAKQQRLLVEPLYSNTWTEQAFLADANVGIFRSTKEPPVVPDMFLSFDVELAEDWWAKEHRTYFIWEFGKPPDVAIEIVANEKGRETSKKRDDYARMRIPYYVIYDPQLLVQETVLQVYELVVGEYLPRPDSKLPKTGLRLTLWQGKFEGKQAEWLRWCTLDGTLIQTGAERAEQERQRAEQERQRAEQERQRAEQEHTRAEQERQRAERLAAKLKELGIDPNTL